MIKKTSSRINNETDKISVLDDIFQTLRFRGSIFFRSELASPWGMSLDKLDKPRFHISLKGNFMVGVENTDKAVSINEMDIVMLPHGDMHWIADDSKSNRVCSDAAANACELGNPMFQSGNITNRVICGLVHFDDGMSHPILDTLPAILHFSNIHDNDALWMTVKLLELESSEVEGNRNLIVDRLTEVLFLQLMRKFSAENTQLTGFFAGLHDQRVRRTLELIHRQPHYKWTLDELGNYAGMSRATLVRQFKTAIGMPPMAYVNQWRMTKAYNLLKYSNKTIESVAEAVGFSGARSFTKAFQRQYDMTPKELHSSLKEH